MKTFCHIVVLFLLCFAVACTGSKKFFKAAEQLEKQGLINDAAEYYYQSLQRKPTNVDARIKLKEVGQKYMSSLASQFFRNYNTQQLEASLESFEKLKDFNSRAAALNVQLDYPKTYDDDYLNAVEQFNSKNYDQAATLVIQKKYSEAVTYVNKVKKYNASYKNLPQLEITAVCEPLYQSAVRNIESKNYAGAYTSLTSIKNKTDNYKDAQQLFELADAQQNKNVILFQPKTSSNLMENDIEESLFNNFNQAAQQKVSAVKVINNTPFQNANNTFDLNNSNNVDLIQAVRKATGADYFYLYDVKNVRESNPGPNRSSYTGYQEERIKQQDGTILTRFISFGYNTVKAQRGFSYDYNYQLINAYSNQIVEQRAQFISAQDVIEYNELQKQYGGSLNSLFPYNPQQTPLFNQYNPNAWRAKFNARNTLKTSETLKTEANNQSINLFINSVKNLK